ncbi:MAG: hypothetical protein NTW96_10715 [Planctomycetia bacterium]|nr:hypothetical protein [Planctomycetia bacterium]
MTMHEGMANPYRAPESPGVPPAPPRFDSRLRAARAGMRQGAYLGAKWMTYIILVLAALTWIVKFGETACRLLRNDISLSYVMDVLRPVDLLIITVKVVVLVILMATVSGAVLGALGGAIAYRKDTDRSGDVDKSE